MKKTIYLFLAVICIFSFASCGKQKTEKINTNDSSEETKIDLETVIKESKEDFRSYVVKYGCGNTSVNDETVDEIFERYLTLSSENKTLKYDDHDDILIHDDILANQAKVSVEPKVILESISRNLGLGETFIFKIDNSSVGTDSYSTDEIEATWSIDRNTLIGSKHIEVLFEIK